MVIAAAAMTSQELMKNYFINSDVVSNQKRSYHDEWIERGIAVTSGGQEYREQIDSIPQGSTLVLHEPNSGAMAARTVLDAGSVIVKQGAALSVFAKARNIIEKLNGMLT